MIPATAGFYYWFNTQFNICGVDGGVPWSTFLRYRSSLSYCLVTSRFHIPYPRVVLAARGFPTSAETLPPQDPKPNSFFGSTLGAVIESYYRSGLNSWLNAKLTGRPPASMFPMFHIQIPTRVLYINGFKVSL